MTTSSSINQPTIWIKKISWNWFL